MALNKKIYLYSDAAISCGGTTGDGSLQKNLVNPDYRRIFQSRTHGEKQYPVAIIPDDYFINSSCKNRIESILDHVLEQVQNEVLNCVQKYGSQRIGICLGSCDNGSANSLSAHNEYLKTTNFPTDYKLFQQNPVHLASYAKTKLGLEGPTCAIATACASSATAVIEAAQMIRAGFCDAMLVVGVDIISPTVFLGFNALEAVSPTGCNPFSKNRKGITLGEGAAAVILCKDKPNTADYVQLLGYGESADANHMTAPLENGAGAIVAMEKAIAMAQIDRDQISYINLHGTGTPLNDAMESVALSQVFSHSLQEKLYPKVSTTKAITGHTLGAAGCLELSICMRILYDKLLEGNLPIHHWDGEADSNLPMLPFVKPGDKIATSICMTNSFAFGGCNTSLIIGKDNHE
ncbi:MAG: beta-ketoacyl synthase N-terminal-like domain-containing protein [Treponema sp.]|nr:beta-ketoacyl synthase N-terminal-like domain-containing protein [Treponema sp.]